VDSLGWSESLSWSHTLGARLPILCAGTSAAAVARPSVLCFTTTRGAIGHQRYFSDAINFGPPNLSFHTISAASPTPAHSAAAIRTSSLSDGGNSTRSRHNFSVAESSAASRSTTRPIRGHVQFQRNRHQRIRRQRPTAPQYRLRISRLPAGPCRNRAPVALWSANHVFRASVFSGYGQDDWRVTTKLTVILGLRYEILHAVHGEIRPYRQSRHCTGPSRAWP